MKEKTLEKQHKKTFDDLKHINADDREFWYARDLQRALDYSRWEKFFPVVEKAKTACDNSEQAVDNHFHQMVKMVLIGSGSQRIDKHFVEMREMATSFPVAGGLL